MGWDEDEQCASLGTGILGNAAEEGTKVRGLSLSVAAGQREGDDKWASHYSFMLTFFLSGWIPRCPLASSESHL